MRCSLYGYLLLVAIGWASLVECAVRTRTICPSYCEFKLRGLRHLSEEQIQSRRIRKDIKCLSEEEWARLATAIQVIYDQGIWRDFTDIHVKSFPHTHMTAQFLPWHRWFLYQMENELRKIDPRITLPYWDGAFDFRAPEESSVLTRERYGTSGDARHGFCLIDGLGAHWNRTNPTVDCVKRQFDGLYATVTPWNSPEWVTFTLQTARNFKAIREYIEYTLHPFMHVNIGCNVGDLSFEHSTNDPLLYLIHANVDRLWAKWQRANEGMARDYGGPKWDPKTKKISNVSAALGDTLVVWNLTVGDAMDTQGEQMSYTYDEFELPADGQEENPKFRPEVVRLLEQLPTSTLKKYFPLLLEGTSSRFQVELPPVCDHGAGKAIEPLVHSKMYSPKTLHFRQKGVIHKFFEQNNDFVRDISAHYRSLY